MNRFANSTIKGFLYQFEKTLNTFLSATDEDCEITVEGIEDIDIDTTYMQQLIQCKYHELQENYTLSKIEKPVIQMLRHWSFHDHDKNIAYLLFCHFPNKTNEVTTLTIENLKYYINKDKPDNLLTLKEEIRKQIHLQGEDVINTFLENFKIEFGEKYETLVDKNIELLKTKGFNDNIIKEVIYPNAIGKIHNLSIKRNINDRKITPRAFFDYLRKIDTVILSKYTVFLSNYKLLLKNKRNYLKNNLNSNLRKRYFVFSENSFDDFENEIICFINEYLDKFQYKRSKLHINDKTIPTFILNCNFRVFENIHKGLESKQIRSNVGFVLHLNSWDEQRFFASPIIDDQKKLFEFRLRLLYVNEKRLANRIEAIKRHSPEDLFIINTELMNDIVINGTQKEIINVNNIKELKYVLNMVDSYEE